MTKFAIGTLVQWHESGIIGEYIGKIYFEVKKRPIYIINKIHR